MALNEAQREGLRRWYGREEVLEEARSLYDGKNFLDLEDFIHKGCLLPLRDHENLPEYMKGENGSPLFPENLDPRRVEDQWQEAIELGWQVMKERLGFGHDDVHLAVADLQRRDWEAFLRSVEERKRERGLE